MNGYSKNLSLLSRSCIQYLLVLTKVSLVYKTFFQSLAFLLYIINLFYCSVQETLSPDLFAASADRGGATWEGGANGWRLKKRRPEHCFPVISELVHTTAVACCLLSVHLLILIPVGMHPRNHRKTFLLPPWFNTSLSSVKDRLEQLMRELWQKWRDDLKYKCVGGLLALYSYAL